MNTVFFSFISSDMVVGRCARRLLSSLPVESGVCDGTAIAEKQALFQEGDKELHNLQYKPDKTFH
jgi:hypothetical protein